MIVDGVIALIIAYLLGSIPSAYIVTRLATGKDIRQLGSGNVGGNNVFQQVGLIAAIPVAIFDVGKGATAVAIAHWLLGAPPLFLLAAGLAVVAGHMWSIFLKFTGGNGLAPTIGVLSILMTKELLIVFAMTLLLIVVTRNVVLSVNISLLSVPVSAWFLEKSWLLVIFSIVLALILVVNFIPTARAALAQAGNKENLLAELLRSNKAKR
ncbi:glycerol-3-phosphate acyltransferase [Chloroflexota bacterium]